MWQSKIKTFLEISELIERHQDHFLGDRAEDASGFEISEGYISFKWEEYICGGYQYGGMVSVSWEDFIMYAEEQKALEEFDKKLKDTV